MAFTVPKLKYNYDALEPYLSQDVVHYHYGKHTKKYFDTTNELIKGTMFEKNETLDDMVSKKSLVRARTALYNNATQAWNHAFYWDCLAPRGEGGKANDELDHLIKTTFGDFNKFVENFNDVAAKHFGSGWCWLVYNDEKLNVVDTHDADNPLTLDTGVPLLAIDVWEHAYYLDYENDRAQYLDKIWNVVNWEFVNERFDRARKDA